MFSVRSAVGSKRRDFVRVVYTGYLEMIFCLEVENCAENLKVAWIVNYAHSCGVSPSLYRAVDRTSLMDRTLD
jgi:hypothetical protein